MAIIEIDGISVRFGGLWAVKDVGFNVEEGQIAAVIGPNGAGKSTLFNVISGFQRPLHGKVLFEGRKVSGVSPVKVAREGIARTFQKPELCGEMTVFENVLIGANKILKGGMLAHILGMPWAVSSDKEAHELSEKALEAVGLWELRNLEASALSLGQQRLLEVARALAGRPKVILLDEPASGLNDVEAEELRILLKKINRENITIIFVEHNIRFVMELADNVAVLSNGELLTIGTPEQVRSNKAVIEAYLGSSEE